MSYVTFFGNQHIEKIRKAIKFRNDDECINYIAKTLNKSKPGYYIIFEMSQDEIYSVSLVLILLFYFAFIDYNASIFTSIRCDY